MPDPLPLYLNLDGVYEAQALSQPWGDVVAEGVVYGGAPAGLDPLKVDQITPAGMGVQIGPGVCWVTNGAADDSAAYYTGGAWRAVFLASQQLPVSAAHATLPRIDRVVAEVLDSQFGAGGDLARLRVIAGTAAASPAAPAKPRNAITLATVSVAAAATSIVAANITDGRSRAAIAGRAQAGFSRIAEVVLPAAAATIEFASIPATFSALWVLFVGRSAQAAAFSTLQLNVNADVTTLWDDQLLQGQGTTTLANESIAERPAVCCKIPAASAGPATGFGMAQLLIPYYALAGQTRTVLATGVEREAQSAGNLNVQHRGLNWRGTAAIDRITLLLGAGANFVAGSRASLYGLA